MNSHLAPELQPQEPYRVLALDGGGSLGVYTLGVLRELEGHIGCALHEYFDLIYGTSTGAIIAAMISLGNSADSITQEYFVRIPRIMGNYLTGARTRALNQEAADLFGRRPFSDLKTPTCFVSTSKTHRQPLIFKSHALHAHERKTTFVPGFGCTIADAVSASCRAYPYFYPSNIKLGAHENDTAIDGGFVANNPSLFALADAQIATAPAPRAIALLSIGVGSYPDSKWLSPAKAPGIRFTTLVFNANCNSLTNLVPLLFPNIYHARINERYSDAQYATHFLECCRTKLESIHRLGRDSFGRALATTNKAVISPRST